MGRNWNLRKLRTSDLITHLMEQNGITHEQAKRMLEMVLDGVSNILIENANENGVELSIRHFGVFSLKLTPGRRARNPFTGREMEVGPRNRVSFRPSSQFRKAAKGDYYAAYRDC